MHHPYEILAMKGSFLRLHVRQFSDKKEKAKLFCHASFVETMYIWFWTQQETQSNPKFNHEN